MPTNLSNADLIRGYLEEATEPGERESASIYDMLPVLEPDQVANGATLDAPMTESQITEIVISLEDDAKSRIEKWRRRWSEGRQRLSWYNTYHLLYRYAVDGLAHLYQVNGRPGQNCSLDEYEGEDMLLAGYEMEVNSVRPLTEEIASRLNFSGTVMKGYPRTSSQADIAAARIGTTFARYKSGTPEWREFSNRSAQIGVIHGWVATKVEWDRFAKVTVKTENGLTSVERDGDPTLDTFAPYAILYSPGITKLEEASWVCDISQKSWDWLYERYPEKAMSINPKDASNDEYFIDEDWLLGSDPLYDGYGWVNRNRDYVVSTPYGFGSSGRLGDPLLVVNCYEKMHHDELGPVIMKTVYCRGVELESYPLMALFNDPRTGEQRVKLQPNGKPKTFGMPYEIFKYYELPDVFEGRGVVRDILALSAKIAELYELLIRNARDATNNFMFHGANDSMTPWYSKVFTLVKYQHRSPEIKKLSPQFQGLVFTIKTLEQKMYEMALLPDVKRGILPGSGTSGRAIESLVGQSDGSFGNIRQRKVQFESKVMTNYLEQMQWGASLKRVFLGVGQGDSSGSLTFQGADLAGMLDIRASLEGELPSDPVSRMAYAQNLLGTGAISDPQDVWDLVKPGGSFEEIDSPGRSDNLATQFIGQILNMDDQEAAIAHSLLIESMQIAAQEAEIQNASAASPEQMVDPTMAAAQARADALSKLDIGIEPQFDFARQARKTKQWLNDLEAQEAPAAKKALIVERWNALETAALDGPVSAPNIERQQPVAEVVASEESAGPTMIAVPGPQNQTRSVSVESYGESEPAEIEY